MQDMAFDVSLGFFGLQSEKPWVESVPMEASFRKFLGEGTFVPLLGVRAGRVGRPGTSIRRDQYGWILVEGGMTWSY